MTSESRESSWDSGKPVLFFRFTRGAKQWCYTTSDREETIISEVYEPAPITRSAIRQGSERARLTLRITIPSDLEVAKNWRPYPSIETIAVTCLTRHVGETDVVVDWVGRVIAPKFNGATIELSCEPSQTKGKRLGSQRCWQRGCGLVLYSQGLGMCNLDPQPLAHAATLTSASNNVIATDLSAFNDHRFAGGMVEWTRDDGLVEVRSISQHSGNNLTLDYGALDLASGVEVTIYPGCAHTWAACSELGNTANYGGDLWMPVKSPYDGSPVW